MEELPSYKEWKNEKIKELEEKKNEKIKELEEEIKDQEEYLESLYHGHRCPKFIILSGVILLLGIIFCLFVNNTQFEYMIVLAVWMIIIGAVGLPIFIYAGRPSSRPGIPIIQNRIHELYEELEDIKSNREVDTTTRTGWFCPNCNKANASYIEICSCGARRY